MCYDYYLMHVRSLVSGPADQFFDIGLFAVHKDTDAVDFAREPGHKDKRYDEDAELIEDKYLDFLHPDFMELHAEDYLAAEKFFSQFIHDDDPD